jgi:hypothetical protein
MASETGPEPSVQDDLLARAKRGEITPEEAEDEALLAGCGPLALGPNSSDLDPIAEPTWTLLMTLVWIITRDPAAVRAVWPKVRSLCTHWAGSPLVAADEGETEARKSWELKPCDPPAVWEAHAVSEDEEAVEFVFPPFVRSRIEARQDLWGKLHSGDLPATGKPHGETKRVSISAGEWADLDWLGEPSASAETVGHRVNNTRDYDDVSVSSRKVCEIWTPLKDTTSAEFEREDWTVEHAIMWIAYRDPSLFHFVGWSNPRVKAALSEVQRIDPKPKSTLLRALRAGEVRAVRNEKDIAPEHWFGKRLPGRQPESMRIYYRRRDMLKKWPELAHDLSHRVDKLLGQLRREEEKTPSQKRGYQYVKSKEPEATIALVTERMERLWGKGKQGRRRADPK